MAADDLLYDKITSPNGTKRMEKRRLNDYIEVDFEVTTTDGEDVYEIKNITVTTAGPPAAKVIVDNAVIFDPTPPVYNDDYCYAREPVKNDLMDEVRSFSNEKLVKDAIKETRDEMINMRDQLSRDQLLRDKMLGVKNDWSPSDFGFVGYHWKG